MAKKYKIATLGCRTNQYESRAYGRQLREAGYVEAREGETADLCIVNTCTVTRSADRHSESQIRKLRRENPEAKIAVTGCMVEAGKNQLLPIARADHVVSNFEKEKLLEIIFPEEKFPEFIISEDDTQTRAFIKVQDGCNSFCSYCIIPYVRGRSRSRTIPEIVREARGLVEGGVKEIVLTGINIGDFDGGNPKAPESLASLLREVDKIPGLERLRLSSIDPDEVNEELLDVLRTGSKTMPSMHIVLQSGSNRILKKMNRKYTRQMFFETVDLLRGMNSDFTFTTDIIVGFPGEREEDFAETLDVMREVGFAKVHMFPYSKRERTKAALYEGHLTPEVLADRKNRILEESERLARTLRDRYVGKIMTVLTEESSQSTEGFGHTENFLKVYLPGPPLPPNLLMRVRIQGNESRGLTAVPV